MTALEVTQAPLPARYRLGALFLLACRRFSADALLLAAEAFDEFAAAAGLEGAPVAAGEARQLAQQLREAAPARAGLEHPPWRHPNLQQQDHMR